ncbi:MAG: hypothetical protein J6A30_10005 [Ruminococcus sp.]|nr:hypothetical protein [Ruminococcus sp.]
MEENNPIVLDRTTYKRIKAMDRKQMEVCLTNIYNSALNDAKNGEAAESTDNNNTAEASCGVTPEAIREAISGVKGIGEARLNDIMEAVSKLFA